MNEVAQLSQLIARKIAGVASEEELNELKRITENDPEMEHALEVIINLWNIPGIRNKKEVDAAFRKVSFRLKKKMGIIMNITHPPRRNVLLKWWFRTCCMSGENMCRQMVSN